MHTQDDYICSKMKTKVHLHVIYNISASWVVLRKRAFRQGGSVCSPVMTKKSKSQDERRSRVWHSLVFFPLCVSWQWLILPCHLLHCSFTFYRHTAIESCTENVHKAYYIKNWIKLESDIYNVCSLISGAETAALNDVAVMMWL